MCIIPYATQMGEISFCAYNTGVGWRQIVENMYQNATVAEWYREHGKHPVYANPKKQVPLPANAKPVSLHVPRDGRLVEWVPRQAPVVSVGSLEEKVVAG
jgi:7,8-dihydro-6-hydroxymethylpterin dimethyltransferase